MARRLSRIAKWEEPAIPQDFPERDWKAFREVRTGALERFCERILSEITGIANDTSALSDAS